MSCSNCGKYSDESERFCRKCGADLQSASLRPERRSLQPPSRAGESLTKAPAKDPDELIGTGIASFFLGDGFLVVGVILSATHSSVSSLLWLLLLIPAFFFYGKGISDVLQARQIRRRLKQNELAAATRDAGLPPPRASVIDVFKGHPSGELLPAPSVTERTTRKLE